MEEVEDFVKQLENAFVMKARNTTCHTEIECLATARKMLKEEHEKWKKQKES